MAPAPLSGAPPGWGLSASSLRWGTWNCRKGLCRADVVTDITGWMVDRCLDAALLSDVGSVSSDVRAELHTGGWSFVCSAPGHKGRAVAVLLSPSCALGGPPSSCVSGGVLAQDAIVRGVVVRFVAVYQPSGLDSAPPPLTAEYYPARPAFDDGSAGYVRAEGEWQRGLMFRHVKRAGACLCVLRGDFNETPDGLLDRRFSFCFPFFCFPLF